MIRLISTGPDVRIQPPHSHVPINWIKEKNGNFIVSLNVKIVNNSKYKAVFPQHDSIFVVTDNKEMSFYSFLNSTENYATLQVFRDDKIYFVRATNRDLPLVVKSDDFELVTYVAKIAPQTLKSLKFDQLREIDKGVVDNMFQKFTTVEWVAAFTFFGMDRKYYYTAQFQITSNKDD